MVGLQNKETFWVHTLHTLEPHDININHQAHKSINTPNFVVVVVVVVEVVVVAAAAAAAAVVVVVVVAAVAIVE